MHKRLRLLRASVLAGFALGVSVGLSGSRLPMGLTAAIAVESLSGDSSVQNDQQRIVVTQPRLREGSRIGSTVGRFTRVGRRWVFETEAMSAKAGSEEALGASPDASSSQDPMMAPKYQVLENLALQRIVDAVSQDPNDLRWTATGAITEFSGENWLLLSTVFRAPSKTDSDANK